MPNTGQKFEEFIEIVKELRQKCPWDREQTLETIKPYLVEEVYEAMEAIEEKDYQKLADELGDMLLHIVMLSVFAQEDQLFKIDDVVENISAKMVRRHPHVFSGGKAKTKEEIWAKWEQIKQKEKENDQEQDKGILKSVPKSLPALYRAEKMQKKASRVGFDWDHIAGAWDKVHEELDEVKSEINNKSKIPNPKAKKEIGDLLFAITNVARKLEINAEEALQLANNKFAKRFATVEKGLEKNKLSLAEMDELWQQAKAAER